MVSELVWLLLSVDIHTRVMTPVARYASLDECEIGRVQWEMQHVVWTECRRDG